MDQSLNQDVLDKLTKICLCKGIPRSRIKEAIKNGASSVPEVNKAVGSGSGSCGGRRCGPKIQELLDNMLLSETD